MHFHHFEQQVESLILFDVNPLSMLLPRTGGSPATDVPELLPVPFDS
jgi:hypothetical protein